MSEPEIYRGRVEWEREDSNLRSREATDLQSVAIAAMRRSQISHLSDSNRGPTVYKTVALPLS